MLTIILGFAYTIFVLPVIGIIVGGLAKLILPGKDPGGLIVTMLIGIAGTYVGNFIRTSLNSGNGEFNFFSPLDWVFAISGAIILLLIWKKILAPMFNK